MNYLHHWRGSQPQLFRMTSNLFLIGDENLLADVSPVTDLLYGVTSPPHYINIIAGDEIAKAQYSSPPGLKACKEKERTGLRPPPPGRFFFSFPCYAGRKRRKKRGVGMSATRTPRWVPQLYRNAPKRTKDRFIRHICDFEDSKKRPISWERAEEIFGILREQSRQAAAEGDLDSIWIVFDPVTAEWGGFKTGNHREAYGIERRSNRGKQSEGSYGERFGHIYPCSKDKFLKEIMAIGRCDLTEAKRKLKVLHAHDHARYDKATNTWRGRHVDPPKVLETVKTAPTPKEEEYMRLYGTMPPALHDYSNGGVNSEVLKWIIARHLELGEILDIAEAGKLYRRAWACKRPPFVKDKETKMVRGVRYGSKTLVFRMMPEMREDIPAFDAWLNEHVSVDHEISIPAWLEAIECGDVIEVSKGKNDVLTTVGADFVRSESNVSEDQQSSEESYNESDTNESDESADSEEQEQEQDEDDESGEQECDEPRQLEPWEILMNEEETLERARVAEAGRSHFEKMRVLLAD